MKKQSKDWRRMYRQITFTHRHGDQELQVNLLYQEAADLAGVSVKTVERWATGKQKPHPDTVALLFLKALRLIPVPGWYRYWINDDGELVTQSGYRLTPEHLESYGMMMQVCRQMEHELLAARREIDRLRALVPRAEVIEIKAKRKPA